MSLNSLPQTLDGWLSRIEACHPSEIELGLERLSSVAERLPIDLESSTRILVAGTNGKGSTLAMLESILHQQGVKTGVYTSPHFLHYNERVSIAGNPVDDSILVAAFNRIETARGDIPLTYFEYGTLAALLIFSEQEVDVALLEVGLGGRLDAVNIVDADIALVTTIALDHTDWLGDDRESIGFEKAGIFRAEKPALCGDPDAPNSLVNHAESLSAPLHRNGIDYHYVQMDGSWDWSGVSANGMPLQYRHLPLPALPLPNAALVLQAIQLLPFTIHEDAIRLGFESAGLTGRMQSEKIGALDVILDVAHNPEAAGYLAQSLARCNDDRPVHLVLGMLGDKDVSAVVEQLKSVVECWYPVSLPVPRGTDAADLTARLKRAGVVHENIYPQDSVALAVEHLKAVGNSSRIVIAGSFYTVADALVLAVEQGAE